MAYPVLTPIFGIVQNVSQSGNDCCAQSVSLLTSDGPVTFTVSADTKIINDVQLRPGMRIAAFYNPELPAILIFPPQYHAEIITLLGPNENAVFSYFDQNLTAPDDSLQLNIGRTTTVVTENGQRYRCRPADHTLLVYYTTTTRSIPPQTTPRKVIVFCEA